MLRLSDRIRGFWRACACLCCAASLGYVLAADAATVGLFAACGVLFFAMSEWGYEDFGDG